MHCESSNHDGTQVPAVVRIETTRGPNAVRHDRNLCQWCAEGVVADVIATGYAATISKVVGS